MPLICVCSPKGGVGKTTLTANLAYSLARSGNKVLVIDFDRQNALRLHFGIALSDNRGFVPKATEQLDWSQSVLNVGTNLFLLPYGNPSDEQARIFDDSLQHDPNLLTRGLSTLMNYPGLVIIADMPPGTSAALRALSPLADLHLVILQADTASLSMLPFIEEHRLTGSPLNQKAGQYVVLNKTDNRRQVSRDVASFLEDRLADNLIGMIHRDESVVEANALQQSIFDFNLVSAAAFDIELLAKKIVGILGIEIGDGSVHSVPRMSGT